MAEKLYISLLQYKVEEKFDKNLNFLICNINNSNCDLILAPELCTSGYQWDKLDAICEFNRNAVDEILSACIRKNRIFAGSFFWKDKDNRYNRMILIKPDGQIYCYDKNYLIRSFSETSYLKSGTDICQVPFKNRFMGLSLCYDLRFPEHFRRYASDETTLHLISAQWPMQRIESMRALVVARAIENQCIVALTNAATGSGESGGHSIIADAKGHILAEFSENPESSEIELDFTEVDKWRRDFPVLYEYSRKNKI